MLRKVYELRALIKILKMSQLEIIMTQLESRMTQLKIKLTQFEIRMTRLVGNGSDDVVIN